MARGRGHTQTMPLAPRSRSDSAEVKFSAATEADIPELVSLKSKVARLTYEPLHGQKKTREWVKKNCNSAHFEYRLGRSGYQVLTARKEGKIVAVATMRKRGERMDMSGLYVLTPGEGIGSQMIKRREQIAKRLGCSKVRVSVFRSNQGAQTFVRKQGFSGIGRGFREPTFGVMVDHYERKL